MTCEEAIAYIHSISWRGSRPGLERISELCELLDNPQRSLRFVHVAGTNGKGSTCAMLTQIFCQCGLRVGTFTSPYIYEFNERMCVDGKPIPGEDLARVIEYIQPYAEKMADPPTEFELITAAAFVYFQWEKCDIVVLEAGLGGRLDSTNIIDRPALSVITGVALDHTEYLGNTTAKIAVEKAGIIKEGCPVVVGDCDPEAMEVIRTRAASMHAPLIPVAYDRVSHVQETLTGTDFSMTGFEKRLHIGLLGAYQPRNAAVAVTAAEALEVSPEKIAAGLAAAAWPARFEVLCREPLVIFDGGHNPQGVAAAVQSVKRLLGERVNLLTGVMEDKDYPHMVDMMTEITDQVYCVTPDNPRALSAENYAKTFQQAGCNATACENMDAAVKQALEASRSTGRPLLALGSLYMYRQIRDVLEQVLRRM